MHRTEKLFLELTRRTHKNSVRNEILLLVRLQIMVIASFEGEIML